MEPETRDDTEIGVKRKLSDVDDHKGSAGVIYGDEESLEDMESGEERPGVKRTLRAVDDHEGSTGVISDEQKSLENIESGEMRPVKLIHIHGGGSRWKPVPPLKFTDADDVFEANFKGSDCLELFRKWSPEKLRQFNQLYKDNYRDIDKSDDAVVYDPDSSDECKQGEKRREYIIHFTEGPVDGSRCKKVLKEAGCSRLKYSRIGSVYGFAARLTVEQARKVVGLPDILEIKLYNRKPFIRI